MDISKAAAVPLYFYRSGDIRNPQYHVLVEPQIRNSKVAVKSVTLKG